MPPLAPSDIVVYPQLEPLGAEQRAKQHREPLHPFGVTMAVTDEHQIPDTIRSPTRPQTPTHTAMIPDLSAGLCTTIPIAAKRVEKVSSTGRGLLRHEAMAGSRARPTSRRPRRGRPPRADCRWAAARAAASDHAETVIPSASADRRISSIVSGGTDTVIPMAQGPASLGYRGGDICLEAPVARDDAGEPRPLVYGLCDNRCRVVG